MYSIFSDIEMNTEHVNKAYTDVIEWMCDIDLKEEAEDLYRGVKEALKETNPFTDPYDGKYHLDPTDTMINIIYDVAKRIILRYYPNATVSYHVRGYDSDFKIDDDTYNEGQRRKFSD